MLASFRCLLGHTFPALDSYRVRRNIPVGGIGIQGNLDRLSKRRAVAGRKEHGLTTMVNASEYEQIRLKVEGMKCNRCVATVHDLLKRVPGVRVDKVNLHSATLQFDPALTSQSDITGVLSEAGYRASAQVRP